MPVAESCVSKTERLPEVPDRPRVLMSAFACEPGRGSEQEVGWRWALEMAQWFDVTVLTQTRNRPGIERELARGLSENLTLRFEYYQLPAPIYLLKQRFDLLTWPYYIVWQWAIRCVAAKLHAREPFALAHHVTFVSFRVPTLLWTLGIPLVFGPVGGAERAPANLLRKGFGPVIWCKEVIRNCATSLSAGLMRFLPPVRDGKGVCLAATHGMAQIFRQSGFTTEVFPAIGIDAPTAAGDEPTEPREGLRFLYVGRFHPLKGVHLLLEAYAKAAIPKASLTLIGWGYEEASLRRLATCLGIGEQVRWQAKLPRHELPSHYAKHDVFVAPSLYESGGLTVLEAMREGLPAIVLDVGGHSLSVTDQCGIKVVPTGAVDQVIDRLSQAMRAYAEHPELMRRHGREAIHRVRDEYLWHAKAERMRMIYERYLAEEESGRTGRYNS